MEPSTKKNQEHGRKARRNAMEKQPSKAPGQDQDVREIVGGDAAQGVPRSYANEETQGISNRPANEEHAFPESNVGSSEDLDVDPSLPEQQGGNKGGV